MYPAFRSFLFRMFKSVFGKVSGFLFFVDIGAYLTRGQLGTPDWLVGLLIGVTILAFCYASFEAYSEQYRLSHPQVDFTYSLEECSVLNARWFENTRRLKESGEFELSVRLSVENHSQSEIEIRFDVNGEQIDTDLPIDMSIAELKVDVTADSSSGRTLNRNRLLVPAARYVEVYLKVFPQMLFRHPEDSLRAIGSASRFIVPIKVTQTGKSPLIIEASISNPKEAFCGLVLNEVYNWVGSPGLVSGSAGAREIVGYLLWLFNVDFDTKR